MKITLLNLAFAVLFFGSIAIGTALGIGDIEKVDTVGDKFMIFGIVAGAVWLIIYIYQSENYKLKTKASKTGTNGNV